MSRFTTTDEEPNATRPKRKIPRGFKSEADFLEHVLKVFSDDLQADRLNRDAATEDLEFYVADQWDAATRARRVAARKPCLTINRLPAFVSQIVGARRLSETVIKVVPENDGTQPIARIREGLIRSIQKISRADIAYDKALENQVICGIGNFQAYLEYENDDVFEQKICISPINDALAVLWDRTSVEPTGADAGHCSVIDTVPRAWFAEKYPWAQAADMTFIMSSMTDINTQGWVTQDDVRVVSFWRVLTKKRTLALMNNGAVVDITDDNTPDTLKNIVQRDDGSPIMREVDRKYVEMTLCIGTDILEDPYELEISRIPVFRVPGWEVNVGQTKHRWGLVRFMKDPQRFHNFMRSAAAEKLMQAPRATWVARASAVAGREKEWRQAALSDDPLLIANDEATELPVRVAPAQIEEAMLNLAELSAQDLKDVSNIHEANLGMPSNEVSGAAIQARQRVSDTGTVIYHDNLNLAIEECGRVVNELIPLIYDTPRIIKVLGEDGRQDLQQINAGGPDSVDITAGKYSVNVVTGPSYATKRIEAQQGMMTFINAVPQAAGFTIDLIAKAFDWPEHEEFARRARMMLPPGMVDPRDMTPDMQARAAAQAQQGQKQQQMTEAAAAAALQKTLSETAVNNARAQNFESQAGAESQRIQNESIATASQAADRDLRGHLEAIKVASGG